MAKGSVSDQAFRAANKPGRILDALTKTGQRTAQRATSISRSEGGTATYTLRRGVRPNGRVYVDVVSSNRDEEYGTESVKRIGALRRAARGET